MAYARIRLNFETMDKAYKDYKSLPPAIKDWLKDQICENLDYALANGIDKPEIRDWKWPY